MRMRVIDRPRRLATEPDLLLLDEPFRGRSTRSPGFALNDDLFAPMGALSADNSFSLRTASTNRSTCRAGLRVDDGAAGGGSSPISPSTCRRPRLQSVRAFSGLWRDVRNRFSAALASAMAARRRGGSDAVCRFRGGRGVGGGSWPHCWSGVIVLGFWEVGGLVRGGTAIHLAGAEPGSRAGLWTDGPSLLGSLLVTLRVTLAALAAAAIDRRRHRALVFAVADRRAEPVSLRGDIAGDADCGDRAADHHLGARAFF